MGKYRNQLPQLSGEIFLTDGGTETTLIFKEGFELPYFSTFHLLDDEEGYEALRKYFRTYAAVAQKYRVGFILGSLTYRASSDWGTKLGYSEKELADMNHKAINLLCEVRDEFENESSKMVISGCVGPRGDAYNLNRTMSAREAQEYHMVQISTLSETDADMISAISLNNVDEAIGIARAAKSVNIPAVISFMVETDGKLQTGQTLKEAISSVDEATSNAPVYYMINCSHPTHFESVLENEPWTSRIRGVRANASSKSHAELNNSEGLDEGNPVELGQQHGNLARNFKSLNVFGGCCGTDHRHVEEICKSVIASL